MTGSATAVDAATVQAGQPVLRARAMSALSAATLRQITAVLPANRPWGLWCSRQIVATLMNVLGAPLRGATAETVRTRLPDSRRVHGEWVRAPGVRRGDAAIYYLHGSGFALCSPRTHRRLTASLSRLTGLPVFCVDYRLAPDHRFPTAADDVRAGWDWLTETLGIAAESIAIVGDSAGGHLAVDLLLESSGPPPAGVALFSPLIDLTFMQARERERLRRDPVIRASDAARLVSLYLGDTNPSHPRVRLNVRDAPPLPPVLIQAGGAEMLCADAHRLADDIRHAGGECVLQVWPHQVHVFQALPRLTPTADQALGFAAQFVIEVLESPRTTTLTRQVN